MLTLKQILKISEIRARNQESMINSLPPTPLQNPNQRTIRLKLGYQHDKQTGDVRIVQY